MLLYKVKGNGICTKAHCVDMEKITMGDYVNNVAYRKEIWVFSVQKQIYTRF